MVLMISSSCSPPVLMTPGFGVADLQHQAPLDGVIESKVTSQRRITDSPLGPAYRPDPAPASAALPDAVHEPDPAEEVADDEARRYAEHGQQDELRLQRPREGRPI